MIKGIFAMLGFRALEKPDPIQTQMALAAQRNESAGERARDAIKELLERNDRVKGFRQ